MGMDSLREIGYNPNQGLRTAYIGRSPTYVADDRNTVPGSDVEDVVHECIGNNARFEVKGMCSIRIRDRVCTYQGGTENGRYQCDYKK